MASNVPSTTSGASWAVRLLAHDTPIGPGDIVLWSDERPEVGHFTRRGVVQRVWTEEETDAIGTTRSVTWIEASYQLEPSEQHGPDDTANPHRTVTLRADGLYKHNSNVSLLFKARPGEALPAALMDDPWMINYPLEVAAFPVPENDTRHADMADTRTEHTQS